MQVPTEAQMTPDTRRRMTALMTAMGMSVPPTDGQAMGLMLRHQEMLRMESMQTEAYCAECEDESPTLVLPQVSVRRAEGVPEQVAQPLPSREDDEAPTLVWRPRAAAPTPVPDAPAHSNGSGSSAAACASRYASSRRAAATPCGYASRSCTRPDCTDVSPGSASPATCGCGFLASVCPLVADALAGAWEGVPAVPAAARPRADSTDRGGMWSRVPGDAAQLLWAAHYGCRSPRTLWGRPRWAVRAGYCQGGARLWHARAGSFAARK